MTDSKHLTVPQVFEDTDASLRLITTSAERLLQDSSIKGTTRKYLEDIQRSASSLSHHFQSLEGSSGVRRISADRQTLSAAGPAPHSGAPTPAQPIERSLLQQQLLLQEIRQRVKGNLQTISSILKLQSRSVQDPFGFQLVRLLTETLNGAFHVQSRSGTRCNVSVPGAG